MVKQQRQIAINRSSIALALLWLVLAPVIVHAQTLGDYWGTEEEESKYYRIVDVPLGDRQLEACSFETMPDGRLAIGSRRGDIWLVEGAFDKNPKPTFKRFASGLDLSLIHI